MKHISEFGEPRYYSYKSHHVIDTKLFKIPFQERYIIIIEFDISDISNPAIDPVLIYSYAGMRRYLWRNIYWGEADLSMGLLRERIGELIGQCRVKQQVLYLRRLADIVSIAQNSSAPHPDDTKEFEPDPMQKMIQAAFPNTWNITDTRAKRWCRAIYKINQQ